MNQSSDLILRKLYSGFGRNAPKADPVNDGKGTIKSLEMDNFKLTRSLDLIQKKLDTYDKSNLTMAQKNAIKPLLLERQEIQNKISFNRGSILLLRKSINVHETTKDTNTVVSNIKNLNIATKELSSQQDLGDVDSIMNDLSEIIDDTTDFQESLSTNPLSGNQPTGDDLFNDFINEDEPIGIREEVVIIEKKQPVLTQPRTNKQFKDSFYKESEYDELEKLEVAQTRSKFTVYNRNKSKGGGGGNNDIEKSYGFT